MDRWWIGYSPEQAAAELPGLEVELATLGRELAECAEYGQHRAARDVAQAAEDLREVIAELEAIAALEVSVAA